jgi:hypothetical protein
MMSEPSSTSIAVRMKSLFAPAYLTLTSIIQGVALAALVNRIESTSPQFDATNWLLAAAMLLIVLDIWHEYLMQSLAFVGMPTLLDSVVPFAFLVTELFGAHFVYGNQRAWLLAIGAGFVVGVAAWGTSLMGARAYAEENRGVLRAVGYWVWVRLGLTIALAVLCLGSWALYDTLRLGQRQFIVALVILLGIALFVGSTVPYWNRVLRHARGDASA